VSRLLGLDLGERRIGVAVADDETGSVRPLATLARGRDPERDARTIARLADEQRATELVVGLPLSLDGSTGPQAETTTRWSERIATLTGLPVSLRDERLTTERAKARVGSASRGRSGGPPGQRRRREHSARLDREAATLILQAELDARAERGAGGGSGVAGSSTRGTAQ
jgi:putative Holliday junction resolvase